MKRLEPEARRYINVHIIIIIIIKCRGVTDAIVGVTDDIFVLCLISCHSVLAWLGSTFQKRISYTMSTL